MLGAWFFLPYGQILMHSPQFGLLSIVLLAALWLLQALSFTSSTKGNDRDHSDPVIAFEGQCSMQSMQDPQRQCAMGMSPLSRASVSTVARDKRGP